MSGLQQDPLAFKQGPEKEPFSYDGYQIVRREMFARLREPAAVIRKDNITFNAACINGLENVVYVHIMVNRQDHNIAVRECDPNDKDAQRWCIAKPDKRKTRRINSIRFTQMLYEVMKWSDKCRYKVKGERKELASGTAYFFDLDKCEIIYEKKKKTREEVLTEPAGLGVPPEQQAERRSEEEKMQVKPFYPDDWEHSFGVPVNEHRSIDPETLKDSDSYVSVTVEHETE